MLNPDRNIRGLTPFQTRIILNASETPKPPSVLNERSAARREHSLEALVTAGFLTRHPGDRKNSTKYAITDKGRTLAALMYDLEAVYEAD